ncbi:MAG: hypothetical protein V7629_06385 [Motiliproteus sp.]
MFIWILVVVVLAAFCVYNWAELGQRMRGRNLWTVFAGSAAALTAWQIALEALRLNQILSFMVLLLILVVGYYQLQRNNPMPKRSAMKKKIIRAVNDRENIVNGIGKTEADPLPTTIPPDLHRGHTLHCQISTARSPELR